MEETIEARVSPEAVWKAWEKAHAMHADGSIEAGVKAKKSGFKYKILDVVPGISFSILWKSMFIRLVFIHSVSPSWKGCEIRYSATIRGLFAWPVRFFLRKKIQKSLSFTIKEFAKQLERSFKPNGTKA